VAGEAFEYTGTAKELLVGFLIALAVLTPIYVAYGLLGILLEERQEFASLPLVLVLYVLMYFASYRARRYRATRTVFRGIRFWMTGSGWAYAARAVLWDAATVLTLGLALPWRMVALERYRMGHTFFGSIKGAFEGTGWTLFKRGFWVWALGLAAVVVLAVVLTVVAVMLRMTGAESGNPLLQVVPLVLILVPLALAPIAMAIFTRWQMEGLRFGGIAVSSDLAVGAFYGLFVKLIAASAGYVLVFVGLIAAGAYAFSGRLQALPAGELTWGMGGAILLAVLAYLALLLGIGVLKRYFLGRGLWAVVVNSLAVSNLHTVDEATAAGGPSGVVGEGLADALDFEVGI
jgi:uncharacterized membrane protein YjgN (DUF898 family)